MILLFNTGVDTLIEKASEHHVFFLAMVVMAIAGFTFMSALLWKLFSSNAGKDKTISDLQNVVAKNQESFRGELFQIYKEVNEVVTDNTEGVRAMKDLNELNHRETKESFSRLNSLVTQLMNKHIKP